MTRLRITAGSLSGRWSITSATRRDRAAWPPSPDTLFSALVAAAASLGDARHPALYWLETLGNPAIEADLEPPLVEGVVNFSPVADRTPWEKGARQGRWHNSVGHPGPVAWSWPIDTDEHVEAIGRIAREVTYIGSSRAPVLATAQASASPLPRDALVPSEAHATHRLRGIYPGRLDELEAAFQGGRRPRPTGAVGYAPAADVPLRSPWGQMIPLRRVVGQRLGISASVPIAEAVRLALTRHLPDGAPGVLTGHAEDGEVLDGEHMAVVPLARVDERGRDRYADGDVLGVGLLLPAGCDDEAYGLLITGLQRWLVAGGRVEIGGNRWVMEVANDDHRRALRPDRLAGLSPTWASATPVVCDRHPRRGLGLHEVVAAMCRDGGLPPPERVEAAPASFVGGCADSRRHSLGRRDYLARHYVTHLRLTWPRAVPGPVLLGRGRYFGLGAMLPQEERGMSFAGFYRARRGRDPLPWMRRLAERFAADDLPDVIDLPTGSAKTEIVVVWAWARRRNRRVPRRLWIASDRRVIVDQAFEIADHALAGDGVLVSRLRGGIVLDDEPILDPVRPQVISCTVDQLGSRLLYRAYGASPRSWPIWAALAGNDSLIVLDEAHLSPTAEDTLRACRAMGADIRVIAMTATPRGSGLEVFGLDAEDHAHPALRPRLEARRIVELRQGASIAAAARELLDAGLRRVAVVCNTVRQARGVFEASSTPTSTWSSAASGRSTATGSWPTCCPGCGATRTGAEHQRRLRPLVVVATQCIEAGADLDFDGMVSEVCPIDALRQRLGRLDRLGQAGESRCILVAPDPLEEVAPYGTAPRETWQWLSRHAEAPPHRPRREGLGRDRRVRARRRALRPARAGLVPRAPPADAGPHLAAAARRARPRPAAARAGPRAGDVSVVWRRDVDAEDAEFSGEILRLVPPTALEACQVPLWEFRAWLEGEPVAADAGDVEGAVAPSPRRQARHRRGEVATRAALGRRGGWRRLRPLPTRLRPGDVVVLPADAGGYDAFGWAPASREAVPDLADEAFFARTGRRLQRLADPEAEVEGDRVHRWSGGVVVETFTDQPRSRAVPRDPSRPSRAGRGRARASLRRRARPRRRRALPGRPAPRRRQGPPRLAAARQRRRPAPAGEPPLAKGEFRHSPLSRLPKGWRHEAESLRHLPADTSDLVAWLVATHHGHARPFWPITAHGLGLAELMERLQADLGYWRLALHEAVLRCADRAVSREEMEPAPREEKSCLTSTPPTCATGWPPSACCASSARRRRRAGWSGAASAAATGSSSATCRPTWPSAAPRGWGAPRSPGASPATANVDFGAELWREHARAGRGPRRLLVVRDRLRRRRASLGRQAAGQQPRYGHGGGHQHWLASMRSFSRVTPSRRSISPASRRRPGRRHEGRDSAAGTTRASATTPIAPRRRRRTG